VRDSKRAWKQNSAGVRTYFLYDGDQIICEMDGSGNITQTNTWGAAGLVMRHTGNGVGTNSKYYTFDDRGNAVQRMNSPGAVVQSYLIGGHNAEAGSPASTDPYSGYGGQNGYYRDSETNGILCTYRFYDPEEGRWLNRDPIGYVGGVNLYSYVRNNPVNASDEDGLTPHKPELPPSIIVPNDGSGWRIAHHHGNMPPEHVPAHAHIYHRGQDMGRVLRDGRPYPGDVWSKETQKYVAKHKGKIHSVLNKCRKWIQAQLPKASPSAGPGNRVKLKMRGLGGIFWGLSIADMLKNPQDYDLLNPLVYYNPGTGWYAHPLVGPLYPHRGVNPHA
jgi:RHS repeat-associated protein